jgi:hypothetical protein
LRHCHCEARWRRSNPPKTVIPAQAGIQPLSLRDHPDVGREAKQSQQIVYRFVKACLEVDSRLDIDYLKSALYDSFSGKYDEKRYDEFTNDVIVLFEHLRDFYNTTLP